MKLALLSTLNAAIAGRRAICVITDLSSGAEDAIFPEQTAFHPAGEALDEAFRTGKSGLVEADGRRFFINVHLPPIKLVITGAVHISQALAEMSKPLGLDITVVDPRTAFATPERFADVSLIADWPDVALPPLGVDRFTAFVALTHDPKIDDPALIHALRAGCFYIGALGSRKTHAKRVERLMAAGFSEADIARIRAPIGLDIGAVSPAEIAVSILGEVIAAMRAKRRA